MDIPASLKFPAPLKLPELAQQLAPRDFAGWCRLSDLLSGEPDCTFSLRYLTNQDRRENAKSKEWRKELVQRYRLDGQLLPPLALSGPDVRFLGALRNAVDLEARHKLIEEEARHEARSEVRPQSRDRLGRKRDRLGHKIMDAVLSALRLPDVCVSGREVRPTLGEVLGDLSPIPAEYLPHARLDIRAGSLEAGGRVWREITIGTADHVTPKVMEARL